VDTCGLLFVSAHYFREDHWHRVLQKETFGDIDHLTLLMKDWWRRG